MGKLEAGQCWRRGTARRGGGPTSPASAPSPPPPSVGRSAVEDLPRRNLRRHHRRRPPSGASLGKEESAWEGRGIDGKQRCGMVPSVWSGDKDFLFVVIVVEYMVLVLLAFLYYDNWMALGGAAFLLPYFVFMLHLIPNLKSACIEKYATNKQLLPAGKV